MAAPTEPKMSRQ